MNWRLAACEQMTPAHVGPAVDKGHHVLQLIAKAKCAARLVKARPRPQSRADVLVLKPPVDDQVERIVRRMYLNRVQQPIPRAADISARARGVFGTPVLAYQCAHLLLGAPFAQEEDELPSFAGAQDHFHLERGARVEARAHAVRQTRFRERAWTLNRPVPTQEVTTIAAERTRWRAAPRKRQPFAPCGVTKTVARENGAGLCVEAGHDVALVPRARGTQQPFGVTEYAESTVAGR